jgi:hypothetical protein
VALGIDGTYVMANSGNGGCWDLKNHYHDLDKELDRFKAETMGKGGMFQPIEVRVPPLFTSTTILISNLVTVLRSTPWCASRSSKQKRRVLRGCSRRACNGISYSLRHHPKEANFRNETRGKHISPNRYS